MTKPKPTPIEDPAPRPAPGEYQRKAIKHATERLTQRQRRISFTAKNKGDVLQLAAPHNDELGFAAHILNAFGTTSDPFVDRMIGQLANTMRERGEDHASAKALNAGLAMIDGIQPDNEVEAALAVQMVATHDLAMRLISRTNHIDMLEKFEIYGGLAVKLLRTFTLQAETLAKLRRGGGQTVRVEHVHVHPGGQAIVGNVSTGGRAGSKSEDQPHAKQQTLPHAIPDADAPFDPLRCTHPQCDPLPVGSNG
jgi:hypothetical protein